MTDSDIKQWPADKVERWPIERLIPYARNSREHSPAQVRQIADLIEEYGWTFSVLVDVDGVIIAGHGRVLAAQLLKIKSVPVMVAIGWTDEQKRAYRIADNKIPELSKWDTEALSAELSELERTNFDLSLTGFDDVEIKVLTESKAKLRPRTDNLRPKKMIRVLVSIPVDSAVDAKSHIDALSKVAGVEVDHGAN